MASSGIIGLVYERDHDIYAASFEVTNKYPSGGLLLKFINYYCCYYRRKGLGGRRADQSI